MGLCVCGGGGGGEGTSLIRLTTRHSCFALLLTGRTITVDNVMVICPLMI